MYYSWSLPKYNRRIPKFNSNLVKSENSTRFFVNNDANSFVGFFSFLFIFFLLVVFRFSIQRPFIRIRTFQRRNKKKRIIISGNFFYFDPRHAMHTYTKKNSIVNISKRLWMVLSLWSNVVVWKLLNFELFAEIFLRLFCEFQFQIPTFLWSLCRFLLEEKWANCQKWIAQAISIRQKAKC